MKAVILAGGLGTRLSEETHLVPKPMVTIGGRPILWHILKHFSHHGVNEFVICLGYKGYVVKEYFLNHRIHNSDLTVDLASGDVHVHQTAAEPWRVTLVDTGEHTQTGGRLRRVREHLGDGTFFMTYGDGVADVDLHALLAFHRRCGRLATVTVVNPPGRFGVLEIEGDHAVGFAEKPTQADRPINGGFFALEPAALDTVDGDAAIWEQEPMQRLVAAGQLAAYRHDGFWHAMDTLRDRTKLERHWQDGDAPWATWLGARR